jgi:hypothetical protein
MTRQDFPTNGTYQLTFDKKVRVMLYLCGSCFDAYRCFFLLFLCSKMENQACWLAGWLAGWLNHTPYARAKSPMHILPQRTPAKQPHKYISRIFHGTCVWNPKFRITLLGSNDVGCCCLCLLLLHHVGFYVHMTEFYR